MRVNIVDTKFDECGNIMLVQEKSYNCPEVKRRVTDAEDVALFGLKALHMDKMTEERLYMICLNTRNDILSVFEVSRGTVNAVMSNPREIFQKALLANATNIIILHNHPSGDETPSERDIENGKRLKVAGDVLGVTLLDDLVITNGKYRSLYPEIKRRLKDDNDYIDLEYSRTKHNLL